MSNAQKWTVAVFLVGIAFIVVLVVVGLAPASILWFLPILGALIVLVLGLSAAGSRNRGPGVNTSLSRAAFCEVVEGRPEQVLEQIRTNASAGRRFTVISDDGHTIVVNVGFNFFTWGETAELNVTPDGQSTTQVEATCEHNLSTTMVDFGQSARDLSNLVAGLEPLPEQSRGRQTAHS